MPRRPRIKPTHYEAQVLEMFRAFQKSHGYVASHKQIAELMGRSTQAVTDAAKKLRRFNMITNDPGCKRTTRLTAWGERFLEEQHP